MIWRKASASGSGNCVEVAGEGNMILVRNSRYPNGPVLAFEPDAWQALVENIHNLTVEQVLGSGPKHLLPS